MNWDSDPCTAQIEGKIQEGKERQKQKYTNSVPKVFQ